MTYKPSRSEKFLEGFLDGLSKMAPIAAAMIILLFLASFCSGVHVSIQITQKPLPQIEEPRP